MFKVRVYKTVWNKGQKEVDSILRGDSGKNSDLKTTTYFYDIVLNFPPYIQLELHSEKWSSGQITRVTWFNDEKYFCCYTESEYPYINDPSPDHLVLDADEDFLNSECIREGWTQLTLSNEEPFGE